MASVSSRTRSDRKRSRLGRAKPSSTGLSSGLSRRQQLPSDVVGDGEGALVVPTGAVAHHDGDAHPGPGYAAKCARNRSMTLALTLMASCRVTSSPVSGRTVGEEVSAHAGEPI